jgi:hypothetical protein
MNYNEKTKLVVTLILAITLVATFATSDPNGADLGSTVNTSRALNDTAETHNAYAGNISGITILGYAVTQTWQGYYGNVSGAVELADANDFVMYNWSLASPEGEVYATVNHTLTWNNIQCFNMSANGTMGDNAETAGATNVGGLNLTELETRYNIGYNDVDGVDETFVYTGSGAGHDLFYTANLEFAAGECNSTRVYRMNGTAENNIYEEALLYEPLSGTVVFAAIIESGTEVRTI